jgi:hypothetical protein
LDGLAPDEARDLLANAQRALERVDRDTRVAQDRLLEVGTRLRDHYEDGLKEDLVEVRMAHHDALDAARREEAQAAGRRLLFETLREERDRAGRCR